MSRFACPEEFSDQKIIYWELMLTGDTCAGKGEYGLCNQLYALAEHIKNCVLAPKPHRYVRDQSLDKHVRPNCCHPEMHEELAP